MYLQTRNGKHCHRSQLETAWDETRAREGVLLQRRYTTAGNTGTTIAATGATLRHYSLFPSVPSDFTGTIAAVGTTLCAIPGCSHLRQAISQAL